MAMKWKVVERGKQTNHNRLECTLAPFISGSSSEKIPFVFLPHRGQIVHPSREIGFPAERSSTVGSTKGDAFSLAYRWEKDLLERETTNLDPWSAGHHGPNPLFRCQS
uniref:Uncharacterized protein n=1 Tax=Anopheles culicifacies TaxID=139723 RepID=A0A182LSM1_9DIPT